MRGQRHLISDNASGVHPAVMAAIERANVGHAIAYGADDVTARAGAVFRERFGPRARTCIVSTGTAANVVGLCAVTRSFDAVVCADSSHLHRDECGAPEWHLGSKLLVAPTRDGKLHPDAVRPLLVGTDMVHRAPPRVLSISQCTELGTVYTPAEVAELAALCREHDMLLHVDGARLCNAAVALGVTLREITTDVGVDLVSFGGTKNGLMGAEAVVLLTPDAATDVERVRKRATQLSSKLRFLSAQLVALLEGTLWSDNATHANAMARRLAEGVGAIEAVEITAPVQTNVVFAKIPRSWVEPLCAHSRFLVWDPERTVVRWMTSFDTSPEDIDTFIAAMRRLP